MKNVKGHFIQFWCSDGFNCADCSCVTDLNVQMDLTIPSVIMIDLNSRFVHALWLSNLRRIFSIVSGNKFSSHGEISQNFPSKMLSYILQHVTQTLSVICSCGLMTSYLCMDIINLVRSL